MEASNEFLRTLIARWVVQMDIDKDVSGFFGSLMASMQILVQLCLTAKLVHHWVSKGRPALGEEFKQNLKHNWATQGFCDAWSCCAAWAI